MQLQPWRSGRMMKIMKQTLLPLIALALLVTPFARAEDKKKSYDEPPKMQIDVNKKYTATLDTDKGKIVLELFPKEAPKSVNNFVFLAKEGFYDNDLFHRVIPGFMVQGGGLNADMQDKREGQKAPIKNESDNGLKNETGTLAMARTSVPDSATSQFFINVKDNSFLNRESAPDKVGYAVFGKVVEGMDVVKKIERAKTASKGPHQNVPVDAVVIKSAKVVSE